MHWIFCAKSLQIRNCSLMVKAFMPLMCEMMERLNTIIAIEAYNYFCCNKHTIYKCQCLIKYCICQSGQKYLFTVS